MGIKAPVPVTKSNIPVQSHAFLDIKRMDMGLTDRQTLKSAKYDRLLYGRQNVQPGLAKHLVNHKKKYERFCSIQDLEFEKKVKMATGEIKIKMIKVPTFLVLVKSDTSADKTFLFACAEGVEETHHNLKVLIMATNIKRLGHCFWCGDFKVYNLLLCEY